MARNSKINKTDETLSTVQALIPADPVSTSAVRKSDLDNDMGVPVMNNTQGLLIYRSNKTGAEWRFVGYGTTDEMTLSELKSMKSSNPKFITEPWLLILNEDVVNYFGMTKMYENVLLPEQVEKFFAMSLENMEKIITSNMPRGMKSLLLHVAREKIANGSLDSTSKRQLFERVFNVDLDVVDSDTDKDV